MKEILVLFPILVSRQRPHEELVNSSALCLIRSVSTFKPVPSRSQRIEALQEVCAIGIFGRVGQSVSSRHGVQ